MEASVDTLVYQLEDDDPAVRGETLQKLRKIAAVERAHFPVRNPRRFLHCIRRRILDDEPRNAVEALRLVADVTPALGDDVDQILSSILPHLVPSLASRKHSLIATAAAKAASESPTRHADTVDDDAVCATEGSALHEETFLVFRKYVVVSNDLKAVLELLMNTGLAHASAAVREASVIAIMRLLEDRYARKSRGARAAFKANRMDKTLFVGLFQALVPVLEDRDENVVVVAEEALGKLHLYWGDSIDDVMAFLSAEDRRTLRAHQEHISEFIDASSVATRDAAWTDAASPSAVRSASPVRSAPSDLRPASSSSRQSIHTPPPSSPHLRFGFLPHATLEALQTSTSNSNADWKRRSAAVETLVRALEQAPAVTLQRHVDDLDELFAIVVRLMQDADVHLVKRAVQITQLGFQKLCDSSRDGDSSASATVTTDAQPPSSLHLAAHSPAAHMQKILPHLVETAANFADDVEMETQLCALFAQLFASGLLSPARASQALLSSLQHRRLQVREEALKVWIVLLLMAQRTGASTAKVINHSTIQVLGRLIGDSSTRVREMAFEAGAVLAAVTRRSDLAELVDESLDDYLADRADMDGFRRRLRQKQQQLPTLLDSGCLSLAMASSKSSAVSRSSHGSAAVVASTTTIAASSSPNSSVSSRATERSLTSASEMHMLASREFASEMLPGVRQSRHAPSPTESARTSGYDVVSSNNNSSKSLAGVPAKYAPAVSSMPNLSTHDHARASLASGGSMSDRSYFLESSSSNTSDSSSITSEPVAAKLAMLKQKATQLRKSSSTKHVNSASSSSSDYDQKTPLAYSYESRLHPRPSPVQSPSPSNQRMRSKTSPEQRSEPPHDAESPITSDRRQRRDECAVAADTKRSHESASRMPVSELQSSPQKIQMLQSSSSSTSSTSVEDRPIVSKYAVASQSREYALHNDSDTAERVQQHHPRLAPRQRHESPRSYGDQPSPSTVAATKAQSPAQTRIDFVTDDAPVRASKGNNDDDVDVRSRHRVSSALRKRASDASEEPLPRAMASVLDDEALAAVQDTYVPSGKAAAGRPISLATRKRLEAKAKQESSSSDFATASDASPVTRSLAPHASPSGASKNAQFAAVPKSDEKPALRPPGAFGKQEPKYLELHELKPLANPKQEAAKVLDRVRSSDWEDTFEALNVVRRLALHHPALLDDKLHATTKEILAQVPNLRSTVSKNSLLALESLCSTYQRTMDPEVDAIIAVLIKRSADSNTFVCESATSAINAVILNCSASKVVSALAVHLSSKAMPLRREVARAMHTLIVSMADSVQTSRDLAPILAIVGKCLEDSNNEVRDAAKQSILYLAYEQRIDAERLKKLLPASARAKVDQVLSGSSRYAPVAKVSSSTKSAAGASSMAAHSSGKVKPALEVPAAAAAAPVSGHTIKSGSSSASASSSAAAVAGPANARKAPGSAVDMTVLEGLQKRLESSNWKDRYDALQDTTTFVCAGSVARALTETGKVTTLFDVLLKRMEDGNAKVNVFALECLEKIVPALGNGMELVLASFVPALAKNLAANNPKLASLTLTVVRVLCAHVDAKLLCQHIAAVARHANSRVKPLLIDTLDDLASKRDERNQYALNRYVLGL